jgi:hypothetical protein
MCECSGSSRYLSLEKMFEYEHSSKHTVAPGSRESLVCEIEGDEFHLSPIQGLLILNDYEDIIKANAGKSLEELEKAFCAASDSAYHSVLHEMFSELAVFTCTIPALPDPDRNYFSKGRLSIGTGDTRDDIISYIIQNRDVSETANLSLYVFRQMDLIDWKPFVKAAIERNPVSFDSLGEKSIPEIFSIISSLADESIYDGSRLALPDEVWNFRRGDGIEKALLIAGIINQRDGNATTVVETGGGLARLTYEGKNYEFTSKKGFSRKITISGGDYLID